MTEKSADIVVAKFDYNATDNHELGMRKGERLILLEDSSTWLRVMNSQGATGYVPCNYVKRYKQGFFYTLRNTLSRRRSRKDGFTDDGESKVYSSGQNDNGVDVQRTRHGSFESFADQLEQLKLSPGDALLAGSPKHSQASLRHRDCGATSQYSHPPVTSFADSSLPVSPTESPFVKNHYSVPEGVTTSTASAFYSQGLPLSTSNGHIHIRQNGHSNTGIQLPGAEQNLHFDTGSGVGRHLCQALFAYQARQVDELSIQRGDKIRVLEKSSDGWWRGTLVTDAVPAPTGWFPSNYVTLDVAKNLNRSGSSSQPSNLNTVSSNPITTSQNPTQGPGSTLDCDSARTRVLLQPYSNARAQGPSVSPQYREMVLTLYPFARSQVEEMSFEANELLEVIDKPPDDPDWWRCRNARGDVGLVPRNYVRLVPESVPLTAHGSTVPSSLTSRSVDPDNVIRSGGFAPQSQRSVDRGEFQTGSSIRREYALRSATSKVHADQPWCWGSISRAECETLLNQYAQLGEFIVRDSESHPGDLTITIHAGNKTRNFKVRVERGQYYIGQKVFPSVEDLIEHYRCHPIFKNDQEKHYLTRPFVHPADVSDPKRCTTTVGSIYSPVCQLGAESSNRIPIRYS